MDHISPTASSWEGDLSYLEGAEQTLVNAHHGTGIVEFATVVGCTEEGD